MKMVVNIATMHLVNAYCQFSQQACTNFLQTYLYSKISTHFFILTTNLHWQIQKLLLKKLNYNIVPRLPRFWCRFFPYRKSAFRPKNRVGFFKGNCRRTTEYIPTDRILLVSVAALLLTSQGFMGCLSPIYEWGTNFASAK